jgi:hypothetical protein
MESPSIPQNIVDYSLVYGEDMKVGDIVVPTNGDVDQSPMIYMGKGLWTGWIRVYCPKDHRVIQVRNTFVQKVEI